MPPVERLLERARSMLGRRRLSLRRRTSPARPPLARGPMADLDAATQAELRPLAQAAGIDVARRVVSAAGRSAHIAGARPRVAACRRSRVGDGSAAASTVTPPGAPLFRPLAQAVPGAWSSIRPAHLPFGPSALVSERPRARGAGAAPPRRLKSALRARSRRTHRPRSKRFRPRSTSGAARYRRAASTATSLLEVHRPFNFSRFAPISPENHHAPICTGLACDPNPPPPSGTERQAAPSRPVGRRQGLRNDDGQAATRQRTASASHRAHPDARP